MLFQGDNLKFSSTGDLHFLNLGTSLVELFKGATGGGFDLQFRGDIPYPPHSSQLYNLQLIMYVLFILVCNVLLLNLLIALMASVYSDVKEKAAAQYRLDKVLLMLGMEGMFYHFDSALKSNTWLHVVAPIKHEIWASSALTETVKIRNRVDEKTEEVKRQVDDVSIKLSELRKQTDKMEKRLESKIARTQDQLNDIKSLLSQVLTATMEVKEETRKPRFGVNLVDTSKGERQDFTDV